MYMNVHISGQLNSIGLLSGPSYRDSIGKRQSIGCRDTVSGRFLSGNFMAIGERCKSMCKTLSGETIHRDSIGRNNPSGRGLNRCCC